MNPPIKQESQSQRPTHDNQQSVRYAGFWRRAAALFIDCIVFLVPVTIINLLIVAAVYGKDSSDQPAEMLFQILTAITVWSYFSLMESSRLQGTVGKILLRIKVTDLEGERLSIWRAFGRQLARIPSGFLFIGYLFAAFTARKQALHDFIVNTVVVRR